MVYHDEFGLLLDKKMTFRVKVQPNFNQASAWKLCVDEELVQQIETDYIIDDV